MKIAIYEGVKAMGEEKEIDYKAIFDKWKQKFDMGYETYTNGIYIGDGDWEDLPYELYLVDKNDKKEIMDVIIQNEMMILDKYEQTDKLTNVMLS